MQECLSRFPKIDSPKPEQKQAVEALLAGQDVMAILPTGFGKSLIYQMFCMGKLSSNANASVLVLSPIISTAGTKRSSQVAGHRSQVAGPRSHVTSPRSQVPGPRSQVSGRMSQVAGHRSQVTENLTKKLDIYLGFLCLFVSFITDYATIRHMFAIDHAFRFCFKS